MSGAGADGRAGDLTPRRAWELLVEDPRAVLVDVRTSAEWSFVGVPDPSALGGGRLVGVEWSTFPDGARNPAFLEQLERALEARAGGGAPDRSAPLLFLCRSGHRSVGAADAAARTGWERSYNVLDGFEGELDDDGHRGASGWRAEGLPWQQS